MILTLTLNDTTYDEGDNAALTAAWTQDQQVNTTTVTGTDQDGNPSVVTVATTVTPDVTVTISDELWGLVDQTPGHALFLGIAEPGDITVTVTDSLGSASQTISIPITPPPPPPAGFPPPAGRIYYGASEDTDVVLAGQVGHALGADREYFQSGEVAKMVAYAAAALQRGSLPIVSIKPQGTWADIAAGRSDAWVQTIVSQLAALPGIVLWSIHHEPENDVNGTTMTAATFKAMCQHVNAMSTGNAWFGPILMSGKYNPIATPDATKRLKVGDWVAPDSGRWFGFDGYNHFDAASGLKWRTVEDTFGWFVGGKTFKGALLPGLRDINPNVPIVLCEYGVREDPADPNRASAWLAEAYEWCISHGLAGMSYFSSANNVNDGGSSWKLSGARLAAFKKCLLDPRSIFIK